MAWALSSFPSSPSSLGVLYPGGTQNCAWSSFPLPAQGHCRLHNSHTTARDISFTRIFAKGKFSDNPLQEKSLWPHLWSKALLRMLCMTLRSQPDKTQNWVPQKSKNFDAALVIQHNIPHQWWTGTFRTASPTASVLGNLHFLFSHHPQWKSKYRSTLTGFIVCQEFSNPFQIPFNNRISSMFAFELWVIKQQAAEN